ncbi:hypothetical protein RVBP21_2310 [Pseudomonas phage BRkr]|nr:hypothetical protein RVBP21_2310 [Pseudomonas phage BRkr]
MNFNESVTAVMNIYVDDRENKYAKYVARAAREEIKSFNLSELTKNHRMRISDNVEPHLLRFHLPGEQTQKLYPYHQLMRRLAYIEDFTLNGDVKVDVKIARNVYRPPHVVNFTEGFWFGPEVQSYKIYKNARGRKAEFRPGYDDLIEEIYVVGEGSWAQKCAGELRRISREGGKEYRFPIEKIKKQQWRYKFLRGQCFIIFKCYTGLFIVTYEQPLYQRHIGDEERKNHGYMIGGEYIPALTENMLSMANHEIIEKHPIQNTYTRGNFSYVREKK